ncbi:TPA: hypothetical protein QCI26_004120 [Enterobacter soli]|nr:hypothetical protein [Enterobacter soli]
MGSTPSSPPINEGVNLLNTLSPKDLDEFRQAMPSLGTELLLGRLGGQSETDRSLNKLRAEILIKALVIARERAEVELSDLKKKISSAKKIRLGSQVVSVICSSGVLGTIALGNKNVTITTAILSVAASLGVIVAEYKERLINQCDIYNAFESASLVAYKAGVAAGNLTILSEKIPESEELHNAIIDGNKICEDLNVWLIGISGSHA